MKANPYGPHHNSLTPAAKQTALTLRDGRILKTLDADRGFLQQVRANNPDILIVYRHFFGNEGNAQNLADWRTRAQAIIAAVTPVADIVDVVETGYNEEFQSVSGRIADLAKAEIRIAGEIRTAVPGIKVAGGGFSVGNPSNNVLEGDFSDFEAYAPAFAHLDYWAPHEYGQPTLDAGIRTVDGREYGALVLRYRWVVDWARRKGMRLPPIYLGEFGIDFGGAGKGFRSQGISVDAYMDQARRIAPLLLADIAAGILAGAVFFCVGDDDGRGSWDAFELEGEQPFAQLLGQDFGVSAGAGAAAAAPKAATLWQEWYNTAGNEHVKEPPARQGAAFLAHATAVTKTKVDIARAVELGMPQAMADALEQAPHGQDTPGHIEPTAAKLGAAAHRIAAVKAVESAGIVFGAPGRALVRQEVHEWLPKVPAERSEWAHSVFRVQQGVEQVNDGASNWQSVQAKDQAGRWQDLALAAQIAGDLAFEWTSMGLFQILGLHHALFGYANARDMLQALSRSEEAQWRAFEQFIEADRVLRQALADGDAATFALRYNGRVEPYRQRLIDAGW